MCLGDFDPCPAVFLGSVLRWLEFEYIKTVDGLYRDQTSVSASWSMFGSRNQTIEVGKRPILRADFTLHSLWRGDDLNSCRLPKCAQFYLAVSSLEQICWSRLSWDLDFQWCFHTSIIVNFSTCRFLVQSHASLHSWGCLMLGILWFATSHRSQSGLSKRWWDLGLGVETRQRFPANPRVTHLAVGK